MRIQQIRKITGVLAIAALVAALNLLIWKQSLFNAPVMVSLGTALLSSVGWLVGVLLSLAGHRSIEGRALGGLNAAAASLLFLGICMVLYMLLVSWGRSWDLTAEGRRDLAEQTIRVLQTLNTKVEVTCFFLQVEEELVAIARDKTLRFLDQCKRYTPLLEIEVLDPTIDRARLEAMNITHASVQGTIVLRSGERQRVITLTGGSPRLEERDFTNALINVLRKTEPNVYFLTGHQERDVMNEDEQQGGSILGNLLRGESYHVERFAIKISDPEIPKEADVVVINNPTMDFHAVEIEALETYINGGGRVALFIDPWRSPPSGQSRGEQLRPYMESRFGVAIGSDIVITDQNANIWQAELTVDNAPFENIDAGFMKYRGSFFLEHPVTRNFDQTMMLKAARSVQKAPKIPDGVSVTELIRTTPDFWAETDTEKLLQTGQAKWDAGEKQGPIALAVAAVAPVIRETSPKGNGDARLLVVGDADFVANADIIIPGHINFLLNAFAWLTESEDLIAMRPTGRESAPLILSSFAQRAIAWVSIMLTVQVTALTGLAVYLIRRFRQ